MNTSETDDEEEALETKPPPYIPPSILEKRVKWDVFLSFRGDDTREPFTTKLRDSLKLKGLTPFMDDEGMERGDIIQPSLNEAIIDSALAIAIISPNYADSHWCVEELFRIFKSRKRVMPVFYHVDPFYVREQSGVFGDGFMKIVGDERFKEKEIKRWRNAVKDVGTISGFESPIQSLKDEEKLIQHIVREVWSELKDTNAVKLEVGLDVRVDKVVGILDLDGHDVQFMNIHGAPGIGKTTLAKSVYNKLATKFIKHCFISNVNERLNSEEGVLSVKNELMRGLGNAPQFAEKSGVLLVLDDVFEAKQLDDLLGIVKKWFHKGSKIIVTSRNREVLLNLLAYSYELYEVDPLNESESLELFSIYAFGRRKPKLEFKDFSNEIVSLMGGLPLALEVFGSFLVNKKTKSEWEDALTKLKFIDGSQNLQKVLKISYDGLEDQEKTVFLDISCLLLQNDKKREDIVDILAGCSLSAELAVGNLVTKSLLKITEQDKLWMHDQIRDLGRQIVIEKSSNDIGKQSRLWDSVETICLLRQNKLTEVVRGIVLDIKKPLDFTTEDYSVYNWFNLTMIKPYIISILKGLITSPQKPDEMNTDNGKVVLDTKWFEKMNNLKLLQMDNAKIEGDFKDMPCDLKWLQWRGCTEKALPTNLPEGLRVLDLSGSNIENLWSSNHLPWRGFSKVVVNLMVINLSNCRKLKALPNMSGHKHLRKINLEHCERLVKIDDSIGHMNYLVYLNLRGCKNLVEFPGDVTGMKNLEELILSDCSKLCALPEDLKSMKSSLTQLFLDGTSITKLPNTLFQLTQLEVLNVRNCHKLTLLPDDNLGSLTNLVILD